MKIIIASRLVHPFHSSGGCQKYVYYLAKFLVKRGVGVEIVTSLADGYGREEFYQGIKYTFLPPNLAPWEGRHRLYPFFHSFSINVAHYLKNREFDLFHAYEICPYLYLHYRNRKPVVLQAFPDTYRMISWVDLLRSGKYISGLKKILDYPFRVLLKGHPTEYCITHADAVASEGLFLSQEIINLFKVDLGKVFDLPVGVDISFIKSRLSENKLSRKELGFKNDDLVLISVNNLYPEKGIQYLVDAFSIIKKAFKNAKLILIGKGSEEGEILRRINKYALSNDCLLKKDVPEDLLYSYYALADIYVSPTLQDDFLTSVNEAMVCGLPIVSTHQNFVVKDKINGLVVPEKDPQAIAYAVIEMVNKNLTIQMGNKSKEIIEEYGWENVVEKAICKYKELIKQGILFKG